MAGSGRHQSSPSHVHGPDAGYILRYCISTVCDGSDTTATIHFSLRYGVATI